MYETYDNPIDQSVKHREQMPNVIHVINYTKGAFYKYTSS